MSSTIFHCPGWPATGESWWAFTQLFEGLNNQIISVSAVADSVKEVQFFSFDGDTGGVVSIGSEGLAMFRGQ